MPGLYATCQRPVHKAATGGRKTGVGSELRDAQRKGGPLGVPAPVAADPAGGLAARLDRVPELAGRPRTVTELPGGLTNRNYKVTTGEDAFVVRVWSGGGDFLAINREHEYRNSVAAAQAGGGEPFVAYRPEDNMLVLGYIDGRTFGNEDVQAPANIPRIAQACRQLHTGPRFA